MAELKPISEVLSKRATAVTRNVIGKVPEMRIKTRLAEILEERKMTQADLSRLSGIPRNQIGVFVNNKNSSKLTYHHILALMVSLRLTSLDQLMYVEIPDGVKEQFDAEAETWSATRREPASIQQLMKESISIAENEQKNKK